jgi:hypothetical protein
MQPNAEFMEERNRPLDRKSGQDLLDDARTSAAVIGRRNNAIRYVAASPARHEQLGPQSRRTVEDDDRPVALAPGGENGGRQASGPASDDREVDLLWNGISRHAGIISTSGRNGTRSASGQAIGGLAVPPQAWLTSLGVR